MAGGARLWANGSSDFEVIKGIGEPSTTTLAITDFNAIKAAAPVTLEVVEGPKLSCTVTGHSNLIELIKISNDQNTLVIDVTRNNIQLDPEHPVVIRVSVPGSSIALNDVNISSMAKVSIAQNIEVGDFALNGSGMSTLSIERLTVGNISIDLGGMNATTIHNMNVSDKVDAEVSGMSKIAATGQTGSLDLDASGMSDSDFGALESRNVRCDVSGMSKSTVWATTSLSGGASGMSNLSYKEGAAQTDVSSSGMSSVSSH